MTAIVKHDEKTPTRLALPGLAVPGLGHLLPAIVTWWAELQASRVRLRVRGDRSAAARAELAEAEDHALAVYREHGEPGDATIGLILLSHVGLLVWAAFEGLPRYTELLFGGPAGSVDAHTAIATVYLVGMAGLAWWMAWQRAFPRPLSDEEFNSNWQVFKRTFLRNRTGMIGVLGALIMVSIAFLTPLLAPFDPTETFIGDRNMGPGWHTVSDTGAEVFTVLGTDGLGRDLFSRCLHGAKISLSIGFLAVGIAGTLGTSVGAAAGYFGGWVDRLLMWFVDFLISLPRLVLLLAILGIFSAQNLSGPAKIFLIVTVLALTGWMGVSRIVRSQVLSLSRQDFIQAARALGMSPLRIVYRHLVPNALAPVIVYASLAIGSTILVEASLSFLGLGISEPTPTWGSLVAEGRKSFLNSPWLATFPGLLIVWAVMSFNLFGDGLRDALDPKLRGK